MRKQSLFLVSAGFTLIASAAYAFIPPSGFILKTLAKKHEVGKSLKVRSTVTALEADKPTAVHFKQVTVFNTQLRILRSWAFDDQSRLLFAIEKKDSFSPSNEILFDSNPKAMGE